MPGTNPFRPRDKPISTGGVTHDTATTDRSKTDLPPINTGITRSGKGKTGKTVRIISPQSASSDLDETNSKDSIALTESILSTSPEIEHFGRLGDEVTTNPFHAEPDEGTKEPDDEGESVKGTDPTQKDSKITASPWSSRSEPSVPGFLGSHTTQRPQYDVDSFKELLLTGEKPRGSEHGAAPAVSFAGRPVPSNVLSPISSPPQGHALASSTLDPHTDFRKGSHPEAIPSDEQPGRINQMASSTGKIKPSAPEHRHGKFVRSNNPLAVPADATESILSVVEPQSYAQISQTPSAKPLSQEVDSATRDQKASFGGTKSVQKKAAPVPPPSRRQKPVSSILETHRTNQLAQSEIAVNTSQPSPPANTRPPPPPARRRTGSFRQDSSSSIPTMASFTNSSATPPSSSPSMVAAKNAYATSSLAGSPSTAPPLPPPRRRGSSQSSYTPSRLSGDYRGMMSQRPRGDSGASSISQLQMPPSESVGVDSKAEKKDVLADLSALQREVDELRQKGPKHLFSRWNIPMTASPVPVLSIKGVYSLQSSDNRGGGAND